MNQAAIEKAAGITQPIAEAMMAGQTPEAKSAMGLLWIQCQGYDPAGFALLKDAVEAVRRQLEVAR